MHSLKKIRSLRTGALALASALPEPADRDLAGARSAGMPLDRLVRDVEGAARQSGELAANMLPLELPARPFPVRQMRLDRQHRGILVDEKGTHRRSQTAAAQPLSR